MNELIANCSVVGKFISQLQSDLRIWDILADLEPKQFIFVLNMFLLILYFYNCLSHQKYLISYLEHHGLR
jgi:hypothetical protein